nr:MAG TPA: Helix-turn-helix XRE-family like protein [Caudoviricetes sp.]
MKKTFKEVVANELRALRARSNLKQKEVANIAGIDIMTVARYENNSVSMQLDMLEKILSVYNVPLNIFFINVSANMQK